MLTKEDLLEIKKLLQEEVQPFRNEFTKFQSEVRSEFRKVRRDLNLAIRLFDNDIYDLRIRVDRIENHLDLPPIKN